MCEKYNIYIYNIISVTFQSCVMFEKQFYSSFYLRNRSNFNAESTRLIGRSKHLHHDKCNSAKSEVILHTLQNTHLDLSTA